MKNMPSKKGGLRLGIVMWAIGMLGVLSLLFMLPTMLIGHPVKLPVWVILFFQLLQSALLLALAVWIGVVFSPKVNLHSPYLEAFVSKQSLRGTARSLLLSGFIGGVAVGALLIYMSTITPHELLASASALTNIKPLLKILTQVLYGGITEEILLRWGMMTLLLWLLWRVIQRNQNTPSTLLVWIAIVGSAVLFALGHLPAAQMLAGHLTAHIVIYIIAGNTLAGIVFGFLYKRFGLESAMLAHAVAHLTATIIITG